MSFREDPVQNNGNSQAQSEGSMSPRELPLGKGELDADVIKQKEGMKKKALSTSASAIVTTTETRLKKVITRSQNNKNIKQIFILSFDALRERKARSSLTILMMIRFILVLVQTIFQIQRFRHYIL